jgi:endoglucanase
MIVDRRNLGRAVLASVLALTLTACPGGSGGTGGGSSAPSPTPTPTPTPTPAPGSLQAVTVADLGTGWNLGDSLEAYDSTKATSSKETIWGNPTVSQALLDAVAAAGFKSVRIPVSWNQYTDSQGNISPQFMARVTEVVNYARNAGLYVIINEHADGDWLQPTYTDQASDTARLKTLWTQIANNFKDYDNHLLFAGTNEVTVNASFAAPAPENCVVQAGYNQAFVDAVRATGGNNASRMLVAQGYTANIDYSIGTCGAKVPTDPTAGWLMMEFHYYDPYDFALNTSSSIWQWGSIATDPAATESAFNESYVDGQMQKLKTNYADKGIPVIIGEFGAILRSDVDPAQKYRNYWDQYVAGSAKRHGFAPFYWDNGFLANHELGVFNRSTNTQGYPTTINLILTAQ